MPKLTLLDNVLYDNDELKAGAEIDPHDHEMTQAQIDALIKVGAAKWSQEPEDEVYGVDKISKGQAPVTGELLPKTDTMPGQAGEQQDGGNASEHTEEGQPSADKDAKQEPAGGAETGLDQADGADKLVEQTGDDAGTDGGPKTGKTNKEAGK